MTDDRYVTGTPKLPATLNREIGAIITRWAYLENHLQRTCYMLLGLSMEQGRLAVQEPKPHERPARIVDLAHLRKFKVDDTLLADMGKRMEEIAELRNSLAHGVWFYVPDHREYALSFTSGSWNRQDDHRVMRKKKVSPEGRPLNARELREVCAKIDTLIDDSRSIHSAVLEQLTSSTQK